MRQSKPDRPRAQVRPAIVFCACGCARMIRRPTREVWRVDMGEYSCLVGALTERKSCLARLRRKWPTAVVAPAGLARLDRSVLACQRFCLACREPITPDDRQLEAWMVREHVWRNEPQRHCSAPFGCVHARKRCREQVILLYGPRLALNFFKPRHAYVGLPLPSRLRRVRHRPTAAARVSA